MTTPATAPHHQQMPSMLHHRTLSSLSAAEDLFSSITGLDDLAGEDDESFDDIEDSLDGGDRKSGSAAKKGKNRPASTAEKKATHNAVERARRESLNARFLVLADMLPGMTQVKRASKAAIVNKSIDLILELQRSEAKLAKENEILKAQFEALRAQTGSPSGTANAAANAAAAVAAQEAAVAAAARQSTMHQHALFQGMQHSMQLPMPMMPHLAPAAMASMAAAAAAANNPMMQHVQQQQQQAQQQHSMSAPQMHSLAATAPPTAEMGPHLFPGIFSGLFNANGTFDTLENVRSESGSPASSNHSTGSAAFAHGLFDLPPMTGFNTDISKNGNNTGSPTSAYNQSPPGTVASLAGSERTNQSTSAASSSHLTLNGAPSPASSNGVPTPPSNNAAYSPLGLSALTASTPQSQVSASQQNNGNGNMNNGFSTDPVIAAFDGSSDAAYLAAQFAPTDLAKAQNDLQAFIAYQQRVAFVQAQSQQQQQPHTPTLENGQRNGQMSPSFFPATPAGNNTSFGFNQQQQRHNSMQQQPQHQQHQQLNAYGGNTGIAGMCGPSAAQSGMNGMPAWQMMMAQHQALVAAYGPQPHF